MLKRKLSIVVGILILIIPFHLFGQNKNSLWIQTSGKINPIYLDGIVETYVPEIPIFYNQDNQLTGLEIGFNIRHEFTRLNAWLSFTSSFKYDHLYYDTPYTRNVDGIYKSIKTPLSHFAIDASKGITFGKYTPFLSLGYEFNNIGSDFSVTQQSGIFDGKPGYVTKGLDFGYSAFRVGLGVAKDKSEFLFVSHITDRHHYQQPSRLLIFEAILRYRVLSW